MLLSTSDSDSPYQTVCTTSRKGQGVNVTAKMRWSNLFQYIWILKLNMYETALHRCGPFYRSFGGSNSRAGVDICGLLGETLRKCWMWVYIYTQEHIRNHTSKQEVLATCKEMWEALGKTWESFGKPNGAGQNRKDLRKPEGNLGQIVKNSRDYEKA